ncbi:MAG TPA: 2-C-methyl-D-erythritol 4-phosphate cytidylyltransferase [Nitrospirales bacterium]
MKTGTVVAVIPAGGSGRRMGTATPKQFMPLGGIPLLLHSLQVFERCASILQVILVVPKDERERVLVDVVARHGIKKVQKVVAGGATRQKSVYQGLRETDPEAEIVVIHDAVRPFVTEDLIERSIETARDIGGAIVAVPMKETVKQVGADGHILLTVDRSQLWLAQTPQTFRRAMLIEGYRKAESDGFQATDEASVMERLGYKIAVVSGRWDNIKITTPEDFQMAEAILAGRSNASREETTERGLQA